MSNHNSEVAKPLAQDPDVDRSVPADDDTLDIAGKSILDVLKDMKARVPQKMPEWEPDFGVMPNEIVRSALFSGRNRKVPRDDMKDVSIAVIGDGEIIYRGEELRADDELVWMYLVGLARGQLIKESVSFTPYACCKEIGWSICGKSYERLKICLKRLQANSVDFKSKRLEQGVSTSLIHDFTYSDKDSERRNKKWVVYLNPKMLPLFDMDYLTKILWDMRKELPDGIASKLFGYYASHAKPYPVKVATLMELCRSESNPKMFIRNLTNALECLVSVGFLKSFNIDHKTDDPTESLVSVIRNNLKS